MDFDKLILAAREYICKRPSLLDDRVATVGYLNIVKDSHEHVRAETIERVLKEYKDRPSDTRPLCVAVFGPPGSGKSTIVKALLKTVGGKFATPIEINLSQFSSPTDLPIGVGKPITAAGENAEIPVIFFDEFDSALGEKQLGWLKTFLSWMQDGLPVDPNGPKSTKALLVFAGGTAASMDEFQQRAIQDPAAYRHAKVPDFISRLHAFLDVEGLNGEREDRIVRRALAMRFQLSRRGMSTVEIEDEFLKDLLVTSHFIHNQRSLQTLIDTSSLTGKAVFDRTCLPGQPSGGECDKLLRLHIGRGPLDRKLIGISTDPYDKDVAPFCEQLSEGLILKGAALAYGGDLDDEGVLSKLLESARNVPAGLLSRQRPTIENYLPYPSYLRPEVQDQIDKRRAGDGEWIRFWELKSLLDSELSILGLPRGKHFNGRPRKAKEKYSQNQHVAWSISLFRMRLRLLADVDALVVIGGKTEKSWGRAAGIAEEVMIAQALHKPVYLLGAGGRAAATVGKALSLGDVYCVGPANSGTVPTHPADDFLVNQYVAALQTTFAPCFSIPGEPESPITEADIFDSFRQGCVGQGRWTPNGLTVSENRELFQMIYPNDRDRMIALIVRGLERI